MRQHLEYESRRGHERAGIARADTGVGLPLLDEIDGDAHRGVLLVPERLRWQLVHSDNLARVMHADTLARPLERAVDRGLVTNEKDFDFRIGSRIRDCSRHYDGDSVIAPHCIQCNAYAFTHG